MGLRNQVRSVVYGIKMIPKLSGVEPRHCPLCGYHGRFSAYGSPPRFDAKCGKCSSLERHRLLKIAIDELGLITAQDRVLHFAPEPSIQTLVKGIAQEYTSADIMPGMADIVLNLENIDVPSNSVNVVIANHVLEHVNDNKAISELYRILRPGGTLIAMVPIVEGWDATYENPDIHSEYDRELHFGQNDHVRFFGRDYRDRLAAPGFKVEEYGANGDDTVKFGLMRGEKVFIARKPDTAVS